MVDFWWTFLMWNLGFIVFGVGYLILMYTIASWGETIVPKKEVKPTPLPKPLPRPASRTRTKAKEKEEDTMICPSCETIIYGRRCPTCQKGTVPFQKWVLSDDEDWSK